MAKRTFAKAWFFFLLSCALVASPAAACPRPLIEELVVDADFIGRVVPISTIAVEYDGLERYETLARVVDRVRGASGRVTLVSFELLPEREILVLGSRCGDWCSKSDAYVVMASLPFDLVASAAQGGDWFEMTPRWDWMGDAESLPAGTMVGPEGERRTVSWRALLEMISGAEAYVSCREEAILVVSSFQCHDLSEESWTDCWEAQQAELDRLFRGCRR